MSGLVKDEYKKIRGFNYIPSYAFTLNDVMDRFDENTWQQEFGYAKKLNANSLRIWFSKESFSRNQDCFIRNFEKILCLAEKCHLTIMPVLYNRWVDRNYPFGQLDLTEVINEMGEEHGRYVSRVISAFKDDPRIVMWDLCNEPFSYQEAFGDMELVKKLKEYETKFWNTCINVFRGINPIQPVTLGFHGPVSNTPEELYDRVDVISFHPYLGWEDKGYEELILSYVQLANRKMKPLLCTETCQGSLNNNTRRLCVHNCLNALLKFNIGWYVFQLCSGEMVSARRDRTDLNAKDGDRGYFPFIHHTDGSIREGHEIIIKLNSL
jgi:hypothetical protein